MFAGQRLIPVPAAAALLVMAACSDTSGPTETAAAVVVNGPAAELAVGGTMQLAASVLNASGTVMAGQTVQWQSRHPAVASVTPGGLVTALTAGPVTIQASAGSASGTKELMVLPPACSAATTAGSVAIGQAVNGSLGPTACLLEHGGLAQGWNFTTTAPTTVMIEMGSSQYESLIVVMDRLMNVVAVGYPGGDANRARLLHEFPAGSYIIWATSWGTRAAGSYSLSVHTASMCTPTGTAASIQIGRTVTGSLTSSSCLLPNMYPGQGWRFRVTAPTSVEVSMQANGFIPLVAVTDMNLNPLAFGRPSASDRAELFHHFEPGEYVIWGTSGDGGTGSFSITMSEAHLEPCRAPSAIAMGQTVTGRLSSASCRLPDGRFTEAWRFSVAASTSLRIDMTSTQFDTYLILMDGAGQVVARDDDGGDGLNSRLLLQVPAGTYLIHATTFAPGMMGSYQLALQQGASASMAGRASASAAAEPLTGAGKLDWRADAAARWWPPEPGSSRQRE